MNTTTTIPDHIREAIRDHTTIPDGSCILWTGMTDSKGYARIKYRADPTLPWSTPGQFREMQAHRAVWILRHGPLQPGQLVEQTCGNRRCVKHLEVHDGPWWGVGVRDRDACVNGHPYVPQTTGIVNGTRRCLLCDRAKSKRWRASRKLAEVTGS